VRDERHRCAVVRGRADVNAKARTLTIQVDFTPGTRFVVPGLAGEHPVHDTIASATGI
jgi:hypothetical protein